MKPVIDLFLNRKQITTSVTSTATFDAFQDGKMNINYAKFLNVLMIVKMETVQVPILAHAKLDGLVLIVRTVYACQDVKMASVIYHLNANATLVGQECFVTNVSVIFSFDVNMLRYLFLN